MCLCVRSACKHLVPKAWMVADILGLGLDLRLRPRPSARSPLLLDYKALDFCLGAWPACFQPLLLLDACKYPNENERSNLRVMPLKGRGLSALASLPPTLLLAFRSVWEPLWTMQSKGDPRSGQSVSKLQNLSKLS